MFTYPEMPAGSALTLGPLGQLLLQDLQMAHPCVSGGAEGVTLAASSAKLRSRMSASWDAAPVSFSTGVFFSILMRPRVDDMDSAAFSANSTASLEAYPIAPSFSF